MPRVKHSLHLRRLGIDTYKEFVIYMHEDCYICLSEGFEAPSRVLVTLGSRSIIATLNSITSDILEQDKASLSEHAWKILSAKEGDEIFVSHPRPLGSLQYVKDKVQGNTLNEQEIESIVKDITDGNYSDVHIASFLAACAGGRMSIDEITFMTSAMVKAGDTLSWPQAIVVDKHSVGGLPGNRTTPIIVAIVAAFGLTMPKTSSRAITSPAGTADTMEVLTPVDLDITHMRKVIDKEGGCFVWGGAVSLSPADDIMIRVERVMDLDIEGQLVASVLSKKIAAGSTHVVIDMPMGPSAKIVNTEQAERVSAYFQEVAQRLGIQVNVVITDGMQPVGFGIGPALEARDVLAVLQNTEGAPQDLRERALLLAAAVLEFSPEIQKGDGLAHARELLQSGKAWDKFKAICEAQGGMRQVPTAQFKHVHVAEKNGEVMVFDNSRIGLLAKLAGAPGDKVAGIDLHVKLGTQVTKGQPLFTIHSESQGELEYALDYLRAGNDIITIKEQ